MNATSYLPHQNPQRVSVEGLSLPDPATGLAAVPEQVPVPIGCSRDLVDVLVRGPRYMAYSVFDCEEPVNEAAMAAVTEVSGVEFDPGDEDAALCGPVLVITH
ncbi:hypothetical protein E5K00_14645 [Hymenobacter aquaticus]|uniref:Uncharacterized protein n=1 Tax=Hymenobacter aquaticus TaxID=1867101 RepID=A0A4Z0PYI2_9BACT|nr:hypothetical protein [Hymenobacter aquaticus]TGE21522.1 hypothetical protein E5K00_14645 [Hymenobacter aquaticus]